MAEPTPLPLKLFPEGTYPAILLGIDHPSEGQRAWFCRFRFAVNGHPVIHFVAGFIEGLTLLKSCEATLLEREWTLRVRHRKLEDDRIVLQTDARSV